MKWKKQERRRRRNGRILRHVSPKAQTARTWHAGIYQLGSAHAGRDSDRASRDLRTLRTSQKTDFGADLFAARNTPKQSVLIGPWQYMSSGRCECEYLEGLVLIAADLCICELEPGLCVNHDAYEMK